MRLNGKVAVITGSGSGIGRSAALRFAAEGAQVIIAELVAELGKQTEQAVSDAGGVVRFVECDVTEESSVEAMIEAAREACPNKLNFAELLPRADELLA